MSARFLALVLCAAAAMGRTPFPDPPAVYAGAVQCVFQDRGGYLWIGTPSAGLLRYDGRTYDRIAGAPPGAIVQVCEDARGYLWVAADGGIAVSTLPLDAYPPGGQVLLRTRVGTRTLPAGRPDGRVLAADTAGNVWFGSGALWRLALSGADSLAAESLGTGGPRAVSLYARHNGEIWAALDDGSFRLVAPDRKVSAIPPPEGDTLCSPTAAFSETASGVLWGGRVDGMLWRLSEDAGGRRLISLPQRLPEVTALAPTAGGSLCAGTTGGIFTGDGGMFVKGSPQAVADLLLDREECLWIARPRGLEMVPASDAAFTRIRREGGMTAGALPGPGGTVWLGGAEPALWDGDSCIPVTAPAVSGARLLAADSEGRLWLSRPGEPNLICLVPGDASLPPRAARSTALRLGARTFTLGEYAVGSEIYSADAPEIMRDTLAEQTLPSVWFGGAGRLICLADSAWFVLDSAAGLPHARLAHCAVDDAGRIAVAAQGYGVMRSDRPVSLQALAAGASPRDTAASRTLFTLIHPLAAGSEATGLLWNDRHFWLGSQADVSVLDSRPGDSARVVPLAPDAGAGLTGMAVASRTVWLGTQQGLCFVDADSLALVRIPAGGLLEPRVLSVAADSSGALYCAHPSGVTIYRPWLDVKNGAPPLLHITSLARRDDGIDVEWTAVSLRDPRGVRYRYRLRGYDADWTPPGTRNYTRYTNLPAWFTDRAYTFEVIAANSDGIWTGAPLRYAFTVSPPWYLRWWTAAAAAAALAAGVSATSRRRSRELRKRNLALRRLVELQKRSNGGGGAGAAP